MSDEPKAAKSRIPFSLIVGIIIVALVVLGWSKGYIGAKTFRDILAFVFILGAAVVLHEFGHFIVAKLFKIRVETFSIGFGPRLFGYKWGTTDYRVSAVPLGGYVKLGGDESNAPIEGEGETDIPPEEQFNLRPRWQKFLVAVAGPVMNILTALSIPFISGLLWGVPANPVSPVVSSILPNSAAQVAGIQPGDRIVSFNGEENPTWDDIRGSVMVVEEKPQAQQLIIERQGQRIPVTVTPKIRTEGNEMVGELGLWPDYGETVPVIISSVEPKVKVDEVDGKAVEEDSRAAQAGLQAGDRIVALNGEPVRNAEQVKQQIRDTKDEQLRLTIQREGQQPQEIVTGVHHVKAKDKDGNETEVGRLGVNIPEIIPRQSASVGGSLSYAVRYNVQILKLTGKALKQLFAGQRSARNTLSGPLGIYEAASTSVNEAGWSGIFSMLGFLSLSLGVFNLLPIPVLDGGAIFLLLVEAVLAIGGWKLSMRVRERIQQVGFVMLLLLMGFVITNDVIKKFSPAPEESKPPATASPSPK